MEGEWVGVVGNDFGWVVVRTHLSLWNEAYALRLLTVLVELFFGSETGKYACDACKVCIGAHFLIVSTYLKA